MKKTLKKIVALCVVLCLTSVAFAQSQVAIQQFVPLLKGYNVWLPTNSVVGYGQTNVLFTTTAGQVVYSLTNTIINGVWQTNKLETDAFQPIEVGSDINGDMVANASVCILIGNTNLIPIVATNSMGQYFVTNWPLATSLVPNWMLLATTNYYPTTSAASTNTVVVTLYRAPTLRLGGAIGADLQPAVPMWETTGAFSFVVNQTGNTPVCVITNLPVAWMQGARYVYATLTSTATAAGGVLVNQLGITQPKH